MKRRFPKLSEDEIVDFFAEHLDRPVEFEHLGGYLGRNQVYLLTPMQLCLKIFFVDRSGKKLGRRCKAEVAALGVLANSDVPVARLFDTGTIQGFPYILYEYLPGSVWETCQGLPHQQELSLYNQLGQTLRGVHSVHVDPADRRALAIDQNLGRSRIIARARETGRTEDPLLQHASVELTRLMRLPGAEPAASMLIHRDLSPRNVLVDDRQGEILISGLIDFERAQMGDWLCDFAMIAFKEFPKDPKVKQAILDGYQFQFVDERNMIERLRMHMLELFLEISVWAKEDDPEFSCK